MTARQAGQFDEAIAQFTKALELDNGGANQLTILAQLADTQMAKANALKAGPEFETAMNASLETYAKVIAAKPDDVNAINNYALGLARVKKYDQAQQELEKAAALDPPSAGKYFYNLGAILTNAGQSEPACKAFKRAIEGDANYADAQYQWGICLTGQAKTKPDGTIEFPPGTREAFEKYMALKPDGQFAESAKGMIQSLGGKVETEYRNPAAAPAKKAVKKK
jgi:tetratricopeptide (TPR) repeat protein